MIKKALAFIFLLFSTLKLVCQIVIKPDLKSYFDSIENIKKKQGIDKLFRPFNEKLITGKYFSEKELKGKITLINFWFASCGPCIAEFPQLNFLYKKFNYCKNFQMLGVTFESKAEVMKMKKKYQITYPLLLTSRAKCSDLSFSLGYPVTILTDYTGKIIYITVGGSYNKNEIEEKFNAEVIPLITKAIKNMPIN